MSFLRVGSPTLRLDSDNGDAGSSTEDEVFTTSRLDVIPNACNQQSPGDSKNLFLHKFDGISKPPYITFPSPGFTPSPRRDQNAVIFCVHFCGKNFGEIGLFEPDLSILDWQEFKSYIFSSLNLESSEEFVFTYLQDDGEKVPIEWQCDYELALQLARRRSNEDQKFVLNISRVGSFPGLRSFMSSGIKRVNSTSSRSQANSVILPKRNVTTSTSFLTFENVLTQEDDSKSGSLSMSSDGVADEGRSSCSDRSYAKKTFDELLLEMEREIKKKQVNDRQDFEFVQLDRSPSAPITPVPPTQPPKLRSLLQGQRLPVKVTVYASERSQTPIFCFEKNNQGDESDQENGRIQFGGTPGPDAAHIATPTSPQKPPIWFSTYMDKFKEDISASISHQIHEEIDHLMGHINTQEVEGKLEGILGNYASMVQSKVVCCCKGEEKSECGSKESPQHRATTNESTQKKRKILANKYQHDHAKLLTTLKKREHTLFTYMEQITTILSRLAQNLTVHGAAQIHGDNHPLDFERDKVMARIERIRDRHGRVEQEAISIGTNSATNMPDYLRDEIAALSSTLTTITSSPSMGSRRMEGLNAHYIDETIPDGSLMRVSKTFVKRWNVLNNGTVAWDEKISLRCIKEGSLKAMNIRVIVPPLKSGEKGPISVTFKVPDTPGVYTSEWSFQAAPDATSFGDLLWCKVEAIANPKKSLVSNTPNSDYSMKPTLNGLRNPSGRIYENYLGDPFATTRYPFPLPIIRKVSNSEVQQSTLQPKKDSPHMAPAVSPDPDEDRMEDASDVDVSGSDNDSSSSSFRESDDDAAFRTPSHTVRRKLHRKRSTSQVEELTDSEKSHDPDTHPEESHDEESEDNEDVQEPTTSQQDVVSDSNVEYESDGESVTASMTDAIAEDVLREPTSSKPTCSSTQDLPKLKKEVSNLHEAFQQRVDVKLDFEALPKNCRQNPPITRPHATDGSGTLTFDESHFVTVNRLPPPELKPNRPIDTDEESMSDMVVVDRMSCGRNGASDRRGLRLEQPLADDLISMSSCSSYSDLMTGEEEEEDARLPIASPVTETEETSTTDKCSQASRASSVEASAFSATCEEISLINLSADKDVIPRVPSPPIAK